VVVSGSFGLGLGLKFNPLLLTRFYGALPAWGKHWVSTPNSQRHQILLCPQESSISTPTEGASVKNCLSFKVKGISLRIRKDKEKDIIERYLERPE